MAALPAQHDPLNRLASAVISYRNHREGWPQGFQGLQRSYSAINETEREDGVLKEPNPESARWCLGNQQSLLSHRQLTNIPACGVRLAGWGTGGALPSRKRRSAEAEAGLTTSAQEPPPPTPSAQLLCSRAPRPSPILRQETCHQSPAVTQLLFAQAYLPTCTELEGKQITWPAHGRNFIQRWPPFNHLFH